MTTLLLDYRWDIEAVLHDPDVTFTVIGFLKLLRRTGLNPAPFLEDEQVNELWEKWGPRPQGAHWQAWDALRRFLDYCHRSAGSICVATPNPEPPSLRDNWRRALRDQVSNPAQWRNPQIIVPKSRRGDWSPENEVNVHCDPCGNQPASGPYERVLVVLEEYDSHPFAVPDTDPWRHLEWLNRPGQDARIDHPCRLPRPPILDQVAVEALSTRLDEARRTGWRIGDRYYFIPPVNCRLEQVDKGPWRNGQAFRRERSLDGNGPGPVDYMGRVWVWDRIERHWDVQLNPGYIRVSHDGRQL